MHLHTPEQPIGVTGSRQAWGPLWLVAQLPLSLVRTVMQADDHRRVVSADRTPDCAQWGPRRDSLCTMRVPDRFSGTNMAAEVAGPKTRNYGLQRSRLRVAQPGQQLSVALLGHHSKLAVGRRTHMGPPVRKSRSTGQGLHPCRSCGCFCHR